MIHHLRGRLVEKTPTYAVIECSGVGYQVHISLNTFEHLGNDESVMLHTHMVVREDAHSARSLQARPKGANIETQECEGNIEGGRNQ